METNGKIRCIVLDAMGVIFSSTNDVEELLIPFVTEAGGTSDGALIRSSYMAASRGVIDADTFWTSVGLQPNTEDDYLSRYSLIPGVTEFLHKAKAAGIPVWCLSNDVERWSEKLRAKFALNELLSGAVISGQVGFRKPSREIYEHLLDSSGYRAADLLFVDDRKSNVAAALSLGIPSIQFESGAYHVSLTHRIFGVPV